MSTEGLEDPVQHAKADLADRWAELDRLAAMLPQLYEGADRSLELALTALELASHARAKGVDDETIAELDAIATRMEQGEASLRAEAERVAEEIASFAQDLQYLGHAMNILWDERRRIIAGELPDEEDTPQARATDRRLARLRDSVAANRRARADLSSEREPPSARRS